MLKLVCFVCKTDKNVPVTIDRALSAQATGPQPVTTLIPQALGWLQLVPVFARLLA